MRWLAVALLLAGCGTTVTPSSAPRTPLASPSAVSTPFPPPPRWTPAPSVIPSPSPVPTPRPLLNVAPRPISSAPPPAVLRPPSHPDVNWLVGPGISVHVGTYTDCTGRTWQVGVARYACVRDRIYLQGHNPGLFAPVAHYGLGVVLTYWDGAGVAHRLTIIGRRIWLRARGVPPILPGAGAEFQTCDPPPYDGSVDVILDAAVT